MYYLCRPEDKILHKIEMCTEAVNTNVIEHTAYLRASAAQKDISLDKYREEVRQELQAQSNSGKKQNTESRSVDNGKQGTVHRW